METTMSNPITAKNPKVSLLERISTCGRNIAVQCADELIQENEVVLVLLLCHQFHQLSPHMVEGSRIILPDYTANSFLKMKMECFSSEKTRRSLFFPESFNGLNNDTANDMKVDRDDCVNRNYDEVEELDNEVALTSVNQEFVGNELASDENGSSDNGNGKKSAREIGTENYSGENFKNIDIKTELPDPEYFEPHDEHETHKLPGLLSEKDIDVKEELKTEDLDLDLDFQDENETVTPNKEMVVGVKEEPPFKSYPPDLVRMRTDQRKRETLEKRIIKCESSKTNDQMQNHKASKKERKDIRIEMRRKKKMKQLAKIKASEKEALAAEFNIVNKTSKVNATARKGLADVIRTKKSENKVESEKVPGNNHDLDIRQKYDYKLYVKNEQKRIEKGRIYCEGARQRERDFDAGYDNDERIYKGSYQSERIYNERKRDGSTRYYPKS
eukprot:GFUD01108357.1.p1 GENE.GFUD01108357.1~~GFUD01108357.1.p1  ORF type:complete len:443 (-),score=119.21 GFUD01108357.1:163-1491(-)